MNEPRIYVIKNKPISLRNSVSKYEARQKHLGAVVLICHNIFIVGIFCAFVVFIPQEYGMIYCQQRGKKTKFFNETSFIL